MQALVEKRGHNGTLRVYEDHIELDRGRYNLAAWLSGLHGSHVFHFSDIASITFKKRGIIVGWVKFNLRTRDTDLVQSDYAITFYRNNDEWEHLAQYLKETVFEHKRVQQKASL